MVEHVSAQLLHALAHPLRLAMLVLLEEHGERSPAELAAALRVSRDEVELHLGTLRYSGLVAVDAVPGRFSVAAPGWIDVERRLRALQDGEPPGG